MPDGHAARGLRNDVASHLERTSAMRTDLFDFELPAGHIALRPASPRDSARMLIVQPDRGLRDGVVADLAQWLEPGDQLVVNDTTVIRAQPLGPPLPPPPQPNTKPTPTKHP